MLWHVVPLKDPSATGSFRGTGVRIDVRLLLRLLPRVIFSGITETLIAAGGVALELWPQRRPPTRLCVHATAGMQVRLGGWLSNLHAEDSLVMILGADNQ